MTYVTKNGTIHKLASFQNDKNIIAHASAHNMSYQQAREWLRVENTESDNGREVEMDDAFFDFKH